MTPPPFTRRAFLAATAVVLAAPGCATADDKPAPHEHQPRASSTSAPPTITGRQGNASITVSVTPVQDVTAIDYTLTNVGDTADTFTVWTTDLDDGRESRKLFYPLAAGGSVSAEVYGRLKHSFQVNVCQSDGSCFSFGPVGPASQVASPARGLTARPNQQGPKP